MDFPNDIYIAFWNKFLTIVRNQTCEPYVLSFKKNHRIEKKNKIYNICLAKPICLIAWPAQRSRTETVHIIVNFKEQYKQTDTSIEIIQSNTYVYYCKNQHNKTNDVFIESMRYDFHPEIGAADGDPLVHLHIEDDAPVGSELVKSLKSKLVAKPDLQINFKPLNLEFLRYNRIPAIQMSLPGVLCSLVADHIRTGLVHDIINQTENTFKSLSGFYNIVPKNSNLELWEHASARHWYNY